MWAVNLGRAGSPTWKRYVPFATAVVVASMTGWSQAPANTGQNESLQRGPLCTVLAVVTLLVFGVVNAAAQSAAPADGAPIGSRVDMVQAAEIRGRVLEAGSDSTPVPGADIRLLDAEGRVAAGATSDVAGEFKLQVPRPGHFTVRVSAFGYEASASEELEVEVGDVHHVVVRLVAAPIELDNIRVLASGHVPDEFWDRKDRLAARGIFITPDEIEESYPSLPFILRNAIGVHSDWEGPGQQTIKFTPPAGGPRCDPHVYVNGYRLPDSPPLSEWINIENIVAIEIYRSHSFEPDDYRSRWGCGAVLLWTRPPPDRGSPFVAAALIGVLTFLIQSFAR